MRFLLLVFMLFYASCSHIQAAINSSRYDEPLVLSSPIIVYENTYPEGMERTLFLPVVLEQSITDAQNIGFGIGSIIAQELQNAAVFPQLAYEKTFFTNPNDALLYAKQKGYTLLIFGNVPYLFDSGNLANSAVTLSLSIYDVENKTHLYSIQQSARIIRNSQCDLVRLNVFNTLPKSNTGTFAGTGTLIRAIMEKMVSYFNIWKNDN